MVVNRQSSPGGDSLPNDPLDRGPRNTASGSGSPLDDAGADLVFHALADATRRDIVGLTLTSEHSVSALARRYPMSFAAVQKHVAVLERAGLVSKRRNGREQLVSGELDTVRSAHAMLDAIEALWRDRIERIDHLLAGDDIVEDPAD